MDKAKYFSKLLSGQYSDDLQLETITEEFPWCATAYMTLSESYRKGGNRDKWLKLRLSQPLIFTVGNYRRPNKDEVVELLRANSRTTTVIDEFLNKNVPKISNDTKPASGLQMLAYDGDVITEEFAQILASQNSFKQAIAIYEKLSLKFPEKSVYFAARIDKLSKESI